MDGSSIQDAPKIQDLNRFGDTSSGTVFDASQYAFFGNDIAEEVELGGLEDEEEDIPAVEFDEEEFLFDRQEGDDLRSISDVDDLSSTFSKLNKVVSEPRGSGLFSDGGSREGSSAAEWARGEDYPNWFDKPLLNSEGSQDSKRWSSQPYSSPSLAESRYLHRTSSYPEQQQQQQQQYQNQQFSSEPILVPKSSYTSYPPPGGQSPQASPNHSHLNAPYLSGRPQMIPPKLPPFSNSQLPVPHGSPNYAGTLSQFASGLSANSRPPSHWVNNTGVFPGEHPNHLNNMLQQQMPHQNGLVPPHLMPQLHRLPHPAKSSLGHSSGGQSQYNSLLPPSPLLMNKLDMMLGQGDFRDQRLKLAQRGRQNMRYPQQDFDINGPRIDNGWPQFRSRYMTAEEIEGIVRMQLAATQSSDPYVDDYYHQACLARKSAGAKLRHHFWPIHLRDLPSRARANNEPHAFLQVDALGRVPFSSIKRPRPLLEVESPNSSGVENSEQNAIDKPLEQEPMLVARATIEDGICLLLDVDDIDLFLEFNQVHDGGAQLRQRRQMLLESLQASLQLVDPLGKTGDSVGLDAKDDLVFLRIVSLPKGRKLLAKYLQRLFPTTDLLRIACMAIFRHLRFLFGGVPSDSGATETTNNLAKVASLCIHRMDLVSVSACLAAVVCSTEQPPLRPLGSSNGSGASLVLLSILERAAELMNDLHDASNYNVANREIWKASFNEFFSLLIKYCINKYDIIMQSSVPNRAEAITRELPMELLRASVPHTNDYQKKQLYDLSQRSLDGQHGVNVGHTSSGALMS